MRAVILAGGRGTRLRPYTVVLPKPLMPIGEWPILEVILRQLKRAGFTRATLAVNHQAELIKAFCGAGGKWGIAVDYSTEERELGTMGPLRLIPDLPDHFLIMNGDVLTDLDFAAFHADHVARDGLFTVSSHFREEVIDYGVLVANEAGDLVEFREKPRTRYHVSMGVYMASRRVLDLIPDGVRYGFDDLMLDLIRRGTPARVRDHRGLWLDIGRPDDCGRAADLFERERARFLEGA